MNESCLEKDIGQSDPVSFMCEFIRLYKESNINGVLNCFYPFTKPTSGGIGQITDGWQPESSGLQMQNK